MSNRTPILLFTALFLSLMGSLTAQTRIMCVGDSITWGTRQLFQESVGGYRLPLTVLMDEAGWSYDMVGSQADGPNTGWDRDHEGYRGWKIEEIEAIMPNRLATYSPDVILLLIGTNNRGEGAATAFPRLEPLLNTIFTNAPDVEVYVSSLTPRTDSGSSPPGPQFAIDFNAQLPALINAQVDLGRKVHLVDLFGGMLGVDIIDGVHPTLGGYHRMAEIWFEALSGLLGDTTGNKPPAITITSPADGSSIPAGSPLVIETLPVDPDGTIARVDFLINQAYVGSATSGSGGVWSLTVPTPPVGSHNVRAVAIDNRGATIANLEPVNVTIGGTAPFSFGLVGHWPMESGHRYHVADQSGYGLRLHRAEFCDFIDGASSPSGDGGLAMPNGLAFAANAAHLDFTQDFAFAGWVRWGGTDGLYQTIIEKGDNYKIATYQVNPGDTTAEIYLRIRKSSGTSNVRSGLYLSANTWHFLAVSKDGGQVTFRIDDGVSTAGAPTTMETNSDRLEIGSTMDFSFDEFRLYNRPLSTAELDALEDLFAGSSPPPSPPSSPAATAVAYNRIDVTWTDTSDNETSFVIERSLSGGNSGFSVVGSVGANSTSFADTTVAPETTYFYRIFASNVTADSDPTTEVSATTPLEPTTPPLPPSDLDAEATASDQIDLSWTDNGDRETGFVIERSLSSGSGFAEIHVTGANVTSYPDTGLDPVTTYFYRVKARNIHGDSTPTTEASAQTWPASAFPISESFELGAGYTAGDPLDGQNGWNGANGVLVVGTGLNNDAMQGEVDGAIGYTSTFVNEVVTSSTIGTDDRDTTGTIWFAGLVALDANYNTDHSLLHIDLKSGNSGDFSVGVRDGNYVLNESTSGFTGSQNYVKGSTALIVGRVQIVSLAGGTAEEFDIWFNPTEATDEAALDSTAAGKIARNFTIFSGNWGAITIGAEFETNSSDAYAYADEIRVAESLDDLQLGPISSGPVAPDGLGAIAASDVAIDLNWNDNSIDETGFRIERSQTGGGSGFAVITTTGPDTTSFSDTGLIPGTPYFYRVYAVAGADASEPSDEASATTLGPFSPAESWRFVNFGTPENSGVAADDFDVEPDGLTNIVERATGKDPNAVDTVDLSFFRGDAAGNPDPAGAYWLFTFPRISGGTLTGDTYSVDGIDYQVLWSADLENWYADVAVFVGTTPSGTEGIEMATFRVDRTVSPEGSFLLLDVFPTAPAAPTNLSSSSIGHDSVVLNWDDNAQDEEGYSVEVSTDGVQFTETAPLPAGSTSVEITGLSPETEYTFRVRATGVDADSPYSAGYTVTTGTALALNGLLPLHIGNSLTQMRSVPQQVTAFAQSAGYTDHASIQSTISGHYLWEHWQGVDGSSAPDNITNGTYDTVILQGNSAEWEPGRIGNFTTNAQNFHNAGVANQDARTWIYSYWPGRNEPLHWQEHVSAAFEGARSQLSGGQWPRIIPAGDAVAYFVKARDEGRITGIPRNDFYSDTIHPSPTGGYFISLVHYAALYGTSPVGLPANNGVAGVSGPLATEMQTMIWEFLQTYPFAGVHPGIPAVHFSADSYTGFAPLTVNLDATASYVPDGSESISSISWEILREGETIPVSASGLLHSETLTIPGTYHVTAIARSSNGRDSAPFSQSIRVSEMPVTPSIGISFNSDQGGTVGAGEYAGLVPQQNWNNFTGRTSGSIGNLKDNTGNPTGSILTLTSPGGFKSQGPLDFITPDFRMLHGFVRNSTSSELKIVVEGLPTPFPENGYQVIIYSDAFPNQSQYPDGRQIDVDWSNDNTVDQSATGLSQWAMSGYKGNRPDFDYTDASGAPQFTNVVTIPAGHSAFSLTVPAGGSYTAISGIQIVAE